MAAPSSARVPQAITVTSRTCGWCPPFAAPGRPNTATFASLAAALTVVPSQATASSPHTCDHGARPGDSAPHNRQNSSSNGLSPSRRRSAVSAVEAGTRHPAAPSGPASPPASCSSTARYPMPLNRHNPSTKYTPSRAGSARNRRPPCPASASTSSTRPGVTHRAGTPIRTAASTFPSVDDHRPPMTAWTPNEAPR